MLLLSEKLTVRSFIGEKEREREIWRNNWIGSDMKKRINGDKESYIKSKGKSR